MTILFLSFPKYYLISKIYEMRDKVKLEIERAEVITPEEIYCSSTPSYNIIYRDIDSYHRAKDNEEFNIIRSLINNLLLKYMHKKVRSIIDDYDYIKFYHPDMEGFNWYGFARQD